MRTGRPTIHGDKMDLRIAVRVTEEQYEYVQEMGHSHLRNLINLDMKKRSAK